MDRCPTCRAEHRGGDSCHRCKTDLKPLLEIEKRAEDHRTEAVRAFHLKDYRSMFHHARRSRSLRRTPESDRLLACAAMLSGNFGLAISLWNR
ncbi:MAG: hypothetical protein ACOC23_08020 [Thermodesulfobacteriota bacterium]